MEQHGTGHCLSSFIDDGSDESHRYYLARRTILEMLRDRGFDVADSDISLSLSEFRFQFGDKPDLESLRVSVSLVGDPSKKILVIFSGDDKVDVRNVREMFKQIAESHNLTRLIFILQGTITATAKKELKNCRVRVELFQITDLIFNITKHVLIPKHELLSLVEKEELLKKYSVDEKQIPRMLETDPVARYYGWEKGQVVKVTSNSDATGPHIIYRCIV